MNNYDDKEVSSLVEEQMQKNCPKAYINWKLPPYLADRKTNPNGPS